MKPNSKKYLLLLGAMLLTMLTLLTATAFSCGHEVLIENGTDQVLTIYCDVGRHGTLISLGQVEPGGHVSRSFVINFTYFQIDVKNLQGEVLFSREYDWMELRDMDWEVVITLPED